MTTIEYISRTVLNPWRVCITEAGPDTHRRLGTTDTSRLLGLGALNVLDERA